MKMESKNVWSVMIQAFCRQAHGRVACAALATVNSLQIKNCKIMFRHRKEGNEKS